MRTASAHRRLRDTYFDRVREFPLRPIRSGEELDKAMRVMLDLTRSQPLEDMDAGERDYLETLSMLIQRFEQQQRNSALPRLAPIDRLKFLMEQRGMNISDVGRVIGSQPNASLVLHGKRSLSKGQILKLAEHFSVSPALFMG